MPNRVDNVIAITGPKADIAHFLDHCFTVDKEGDELEFDFDCVIPLPNDDECASPHWGTRKNALGTAFLDKRPDGLLLWISTAGTLPEPVYRKLGELFPSLAFVVTAMDPSEGRAMTMTVRGERSHVDSANFCTIYEMIYGELPPSYAIDEDGEAMTAYGLPRPTSGALFMPS